MLLFSHCLSLPPSLKQEQFTCRASSSSCDCRCTVWRKASICLATASSGSGKSVCIVLFIPILLIYLSYQPSLPFLYFRHLQLHLMAWQKQPCRDVLERCWRRLVHLPHFQCLFILFYSTLLLPYSHCCCWWCCVFVSGVALASSVGLCCRWWCRVGGRWVSVVVGAG